MEQVVYADVLLVINFIINYLLLLASGLLGGRGIKRKKLILSALVGAFSSFVIFMPPFGFWLMTAFKLAVAALMIWLAYDYIGICVLLRDIFIFFTASYLFAGVCVALWLNTSMRGFMCYNGVTYFSVSLVSLMFSVSTAYAAILLYERLRSGKPQKNSSAEVDMSLFGARVHLHALIDTGNHLTEPFSGYPVAVVGLGEVRQALPLEIAAAVLGGGMGAENLCSYNSGARLIPYSAVGESGALPAFRPDSFYMSYGDETYSIENIYVAISPQKIGTGSYNIIIGDNTTKIPIKKGVRI